MAKKLICISCPIGCRLTAVREEGSGEWSVSGNRCPRGRVYAQNELTDPHRLKVEIPVKKGEVLIRNVENSGIDVIFSCDCLK